MKTGFTGKIYMLAGLACVLAFVVSGCVGTPERNPVPQELINRAEISGIPEARFWGMGLSIQ